MYFLLERFDAYGISGGIGEFICSSKAPANVPRV
jgi:hypothetical protein